LNDQTNFPKRKSPRLVGYDYAREGAYSITVCTHERINHFGQITNGIMYLNAIGMIVNTCWNEIPIHYPSVELDAFVIMPNHLHGILVFDDLVSVSAHSRSLGVIVSTFKAAVTRRIAKLTLTEPPTRLWQRNYYDHIIRNEADLNRIREYVMSNPERWQEDRFYGM